MEKTLKLKRNWAKPEEELVLMTRLRNIVSSGLDGPFERDDGYKWQLDASNNWWAELRTAENDKPGEKTSLVLCARYHDEKTVEAVLRVVSAIIDWEP
jgi:hypothetical protein